MSDNQASAPERCPDCGQDNDPADLMCRRCGKALSGAAAPQRKKLVNPHAAPAAAPAAEPDRAAVSPAASTPVRSPVKLVNPNPTPPIQPSATPPYQPSPVKLVNPHAVTERAAPTGGIHGPTVPLAPDHAALVAAASATPAHRAGSAPAAAPPGAGLAQPQAYGSAAQPSRSTPWLAIVGAGVVASAAVLLAVRLAQSTRADSPSPDDPPPVPLPVPTSAAPTADPGPASAEPPPPTTSIPAGGSGALPPELLNRLKAATVAVFARSGGPGMSLGSGFFVSDDGLVITNHHVIAPAGSSGYLSVRLFGGTDISDVECLAADQRRDLALLRLPGVRPQATLALHRGPRVEQTTPVVVIGHPQEELWSITQGTITGYRQQDGQPFYGTDARIEQGNSGGPVVLKSSSEVIGVADWKIRATSMNYAIPADVVVDFFQSHKGDRGRKCGRR